MRLGTDTVVAPDEAADETDAPAGADGAAEGGADHTDRDAAGDVVGVDSTSSSGWWKRCPANRSAAAVVAIVIALGALTAWLGWQTKSLHDKANRDASFVEAARRAAVNLTTIDWQHADADVQRITDWATGAFYDDFSNRSKPFIDVVQKIKSKSTGTVTAAGLESTSGDDARVLVAVSVKTSTAAAPQEQLRAWRLRVTLTGADRGVKVSNVEFVP